MGGHDDFAQSAVIDKDVQLRAKSTGLSNVEIAEELTATDGHLERLNRSLRTEAAIAPSAFAQTHDADRAGRVVFQADYDFDVLPRFNVADVDLGLWNDQRRPDRLTCVFIHA
jgi:hypothetical protein